MKLFAKLASTVVALMLTVPAVAENVSANVEIDSQALSLNGAGYRTRFGLKIYEVGLYLDTPNKDANQVLSADEPQLIRMDIRSGLVSKALIEEVVIAGFKSGRTYDQFREEIGMLLDTFSETTGKGDYVDLYYQPGLGLKTYQNGEQKVVIESGVEFKQALYGIWLGDSPVQRRLKKYMLGIKKPRKAKT